MTTAANPTNETLDLLKAAQAAPDEALAKSFTQSNALVAFNLEGPSKKLYPVLTPNRNRIARNSNGKGTAVNWKAVTAINPSGVGAGVSEGNRGAVIDQTTADYAVGYKGVGLENSVTFEADYAGKSYEDAKALATQQLLQATMISEERIITFGNGSRALGTTPTPSLVANGSGGTFSAATFSVICVALTHAGFRRASLAAGVPGLVTKTNADGSVDTFGGGAAQKSANATVAVGASGSIAASVVAVFGAVGYAWFVGAAGSERIAAITTVNKVTLTSAPGAGQLASALTAADYSTNALIYDGLFTYASNPALGGYQKSLDGATLTSDGAGGIVEFTAMFQWFWDTWKLSPNELEMSATTALKINALVIANNGAPLIRFTAPATDQHGMLTAGVAVGSILNPITNTVVKLVVHPDAVPGTIMAKTFELPYPASGVSNVIEIELRREYYQLEWPLRTRKYEFGVYCDGVLKHYAPFAWGAICNIG